MRGLLTRWLPATMALLCLAVVGLLVQRGVQASACAPCLPSLDVGDYLNRALDLGEAFAAADPGLLAERLLTPNVHPPGHPLVLAVSFELFGASIAKAAWLSVAENLLALALLMGLGWRMAGRVGLGAGLLAAALTAGSLEHLRLLMAPMTEPLALVCTLTALLAMLRNLRRRTLGSSLALGLALSAAGLVRYNLLPMLVVPWVLASLTLLLREPRSLLAPWNLLWVTPPALVFGGWVALRPELPQAVRHFLSNVDSGLPTWSAENLLWAPRTLAQDYLGSELLAWPLAMLLVAGLLTTVWRVSRRGELSASTQAAWTLHLFVWVGLTVVTLHPYKLVRVLHNLAPVMGLLACWTGLQWWESRSPNARGAVLSGALLVGAGLGLLRAEQLQDPGLLGRLEFTQRGERDAVIDALLVLAEGHERVAVSGSHPALSSKSLTLALRLAAPGRVVTVDRALHPGCRGDSQAHPNQRCEPEHTAALMRDPVLGPGTLVLAVQRSRSLGSGTPHKVRQSRKLHRERSGQHWSHWNAKRVGALAIEHGWVAGEPLQFAGGQGLVHSYVFSPGP